MNEAPRVPSTRPLRWTGWTTTAELLASRYSELFREQADASCGARSRAALARRKTDPALERAAHSLKGAAANISAEEVREAALRRGAGRAGRRLGGGAGRSLGRVDSPLRCRAWTPRIAVSFKRGIEPS